MNLMLIAWTSGPPASRRELAPVPMASLADAMAWCEREAGAISHAFVAEHVHRGWYRQRYGIGLDAGRAVSRDLGFSSCFYDCGGLS